TEREQAEASLGTPAVIRGRCTDLATSAALETCELKVNGWPALQSKLEAFEKAHGRVEWKDPPGQSTGSDGSFEFAFIPPRPYQFMLTISAPGRVTMQGRWSSLKSGEVVDLGDIGIPRGTILRGRVIDESGSTRSGIKVTLSCQREHTKQLAPRMSQEV